MLTAAEQLLLELVNRARLDPAGEAARLGIDLNAGLAPGTLAPAPRQPLAPNLLLTEASRAHGDWLIANDAFSHTGVGGSSAAERVTAAGYDYWTMGENLALYRVFPGPIDSDAAIPIHHDGLFESPGHRTNLLAAPFREIGIGQSLGPWEHDGRIWSASIAVETFGTSGTDAHVTGVAFVDADGDGAYDIGEGAGGIAVAGAGGTTQTEAGSGGYGMAIAGAAGWTDLSIGAASLRARLCTENAKLDHVETASGRIEIRASIDLELVSGATQARLLGAGDLSLRGSAGDDVLAGNVGANAIGGGAGHDGIAGGAGDDTLAGGMGGDVLEGGAGDDVAAGGAGQDILRGGAGDDVLSGGGWADLLDGGDGADLLMGGPGDDALHGGAGPDRLFGGPGHDRLDGGTGDDMLDGGPGHDSLFAGAGHDLLRGGAGRDLLEGGSGRDTLAGGAWHDTLRGGAGADTLSGGPGDDLLDAGAGPDLLIGGSGSDRFVFSGEWGRDRIADFDPAVDHLVIAVQEGTPSGHAAFFAGLRETPQGALYDATGDERSTILFSGHDAESLAGLTLLIV